MGLPFGKKVPKNRVEPSLSEKKKFFFQERAFCKGETLEMEKNCAPTINETSHQKPWKGTRLNPKPKTLVPCWLGKHPRRTNRITKGPF